MKPHGIAVIGCGLIGERRARTAAAHARTELRVVADTDHARREAIGARHGAAATDSWRDAIARDDVGAVVVCTPNAFLAPIGIAALHAGKHVFIEKPMGVNAGEAEMLHDAAVAAARVLKVGFNHRYHPAIARAYALYQAGAIGRVVQLRARYGHGARPGCEREWRGDARLAGGGELLDQGVHVIDLFHWFAGEPVRVHAELQTAVWPLRALEDNAFGLMRFDDGVVGQFHVSMTQWKNLFSFEVHGETGAVTVRGLGGSYGTERLRLVRRNRAGGVPDEAQETFDGPDSSWSAEWDDFAAALDGAPLIHGRSADGVRVMRSVDALYAAAGRERASSGHVGEVSA